MTDERLADVVSIVAALACVAIALMLFSGCYGRGIPTCKMEALGCDEPPDYPTDLPPIGVMRLQYKGCMRSCGRFYRFDGALPQAECGADRVDECTYSPVWGEPNDVALNLAEDS